MHYSACCNLDLASSASRLSSGTGATATREVATSFAASRSMPLLLLGIVTVAFLISRLTPADPLVSIVGERQLDNHEVVARGQVASGASTSTCPSNT